MAIDKIFDGATVDGIADNLFNSVSNSVSEIKAMQQRKAAENVQLVIQALKKIDSDIREKYDGVTTVIEKRVSTIKDGRDGINGKDGRDGKDGRNGKDGAPGPRGMDGARGMDGRDGEDGVSVTYARIDFDGSLIIGLSTGREMNVGEVVAPDLAEKIKVITNGGGTSQLVLDALANLQTQINDIDGFLDYKGTWDASTNTPTLVSSTGTKGDYYVVSVAGSTTLDGESSWGVGDWVVFNNSTWQKVDGGSTGNLTTAIISTSLTLSYGTASTALALDASKNVVSLANTGTGDNVLATSPTLITPALGTPTSGDLANCTFPTLNQNTTGTAANVTGIVAVVNGGTGTDTPSLVAGTNVSISGSWPNQTVNSTAGGGDVVGPASATDNALARFDTTTGELIQNSVAILDDSGNLTGIANLTVNDNTILGSSNSDTVTFTARVNSDIDPSTNNAYDLGRNSHAWRNLYLTGTASIATADINAGTIDNTSIGATTANTGAFTTLSASSTVSGTGFSTYLASPPAIGTTAAAAGAFTTLSATGVTTVQAGSAAAPAITTSGDTNTGIFFPAADTIAFAEGGVESARLDSSGNLGLGVTPRNSNTSVRSLELLGGSLANFSTSTVNLTQNNAGDDKYIVTAPATTYQQAGGVHRWFTAPSGTAGNAISFTQAMTLDASGRLMVGTTSPVSSGITITGGYWSRSADLGTVGGVAPSNGGIVDVSSFNGSGGTITFTTANTSGSNAERARIDSSGNLLVGKTVSQDNNQTGMVIYGGANEGIVTATLDAASGVNTYHLFNLNATNNGYRFYVNVDGGIRNYSGNNSNLSDERTKKNIDVAGGYLNKICAIPVKLFNYKNEAEGEQRTLGVIAQDVEAVAPEFVNTNGWLDQPPEGEEPLKSVYTTDMMFALMKCIQEQQALIQTLTARVAALESN